MTETPQPARVRLGEGKISGYLSTFLGLVSLGAVICFHFPEFLTSAELRAHYSVDVLRAVLFGCLLLAYGFGFISATIGRQRRLGLIGLSIATVAVLLGGTGVEVEAFEQGPVAISLDWLLIDILALSAIFIPIELFWPKRPVQTKFHIEWRTDLVYFAVGHLLLQYTAIVVQSPAESLFGSMGLAGVHAWVSSLPIWIQVLLAMLVADLAQYAVHRAFHTVPFLWRFHAVHHSIHTVDWMAGSRLHIVDILVTRSISYMPLYVLGF
ncbi:UNVERIFIED_CONTAM: hypothetical protein GTU68_060072, partial [Idotea baltica]|nr:hypothetical protein [Idotea baltica]